MSSNFQTTTHGKWILAGEHAVIRGAPAIVFPITDKSLTLTYNQIPNTSLEIVTNYNHELNLDINEVTKEIISKAFALISASAAKYSGQITINSNITAGLGMGASAALCVAISKWFLNCSLIRDTELYSFAKTLENHFHGQSSGLDIAAVLADKGIYFKDGQYQELTSTWQPKWQLSTCGETSTTASCINKVQELWDKDINLGKELDKQMANSVELAKLALTNYTDTSQSQLIKAINLASDCFQRWGLISPTMQDHMQTLLSKGAKAVKPTGSGGGGLVVSLW